MLTSATGGSDVLRIVTVTASPPGRATAYVNRYPPIFANTNPGASKNPVKVKDPSAPVVAVIAARPSPRLNTLTPASGLPSVPTTRPRTAPPIATSFTVPRSGICPASPVTCFDSPFPYLSRRTVKWYLSRGQRAPDSNRPSVSVVTDSTPRDDPYLDSSPSPQ